jgi:hypothetical protein
MNKFIEVRYFQWTKGTPLLFLSFTKVMTFSSLF